jgi:hypothetical protein
MSSTSLSVDSHPDIDVVPAPRTIRMGWPDACHPLTRRRAWFLLLWWTQVATRPLTERRCCGRRDNPRVLKVEVLFGHDPVGSNPVAA